MADNDGKITIREFEERDAESVTEFLARLQDCVARLDQLKQHYPYAEFDKGSFFQVQLKAVREKNGKILVAESEGTLVGAVVGWMKDDEGQGAVECRPLRRAYVSDLFVDASRRGEGIGELLMTGLEEYFRSQGCDYVALTCMAKNEGARRFYDRIGYEDYAVRMVKSLN